jgi:hypothetical protein
MPITGCAAGRLVDTDGMNGLMRPWRLRTDITAVVFTCPEADLARFSVTTGPCVPPTGSERPLVSRLLQDGGETPALTAALYTALTGRPAADALRVVEQRGRAVLSVCSDHFLDAMADCCEESLRLADEDEEKGDKNLTIFGAQQDAICNAWMRAGRWPRQVAGLQNRAVRLGTAREARQAGQRLFVWHGPSVPQFIVVAGQGPYPGRR